MANLFLTKTPKFNVAPVRYETGPWGGSYHDRGPKGTFFCTRLPSVKTIYS